jgi:asparagine synthase (glutamine-hydrolysing)
MSAFCGWIGRPRNDVPPSELLDAMAQSFRGRRFGNTSATSSFAAAWVTTPKPHSSFCDDEDPWVVIVGFPRWRAPLLAEEQRVRGPAKALRRAYRNHGIGLLDQLAGPFSFAVIDHTNRRAIAAVDRIGVHSLYYASEASDALIFGSSADMVRAHPDVGASVPLQAVYNYLHAFVCRSPGTIYAEQCKLGPAQYLLWESGHIDVRTYWQMPFAPDRAHSPEELHEELVAKVRQAVRTSVACGDVEHVGAFLSGGLDSSTITGFLSEVSLGPAETFTIGFDEASYDEMRYAEAVTRKFSTNAHRYWLTADDTVEVVPRIAAYYDEPFGNSSAVPAYICAAQARRAGIRHMLAGDGGDEILAGNSRYLEQAVYAHYERLPGMLRAALKSAAFHTPLLHKSALWKKAQRYIARAEVPLPERLEAYNFYQLDRLTEIFDVDVLRELDLEAPWREMREIYEGATSGDPLQRMMHLDLKQALADADLKKVTGMCDLAQVDVSFPFLDDDLVAFCATIPPELQLKDDRLRAFFKEAFRNFLPEEVIAKKKHGFGMPFYEWTRDHPRLREMAYDSVGRLRGRHLVRSDFLDRVLMEHSRPEATAYDGLVWDLMMLELWFDSHGC